MVAVAACSANSSNTSSNITRSDVQGWLERIPTKSGEFWYVVCEQWFSSFVSQFLDMAGDKFGPPRPTCKPGNSNLLDEDGKIRRDLIMDMDYRIVPKDCWERLVEYYGINRKDHEQEVTIIQDGDALGPELYKYEVTMQRDNVDKPYTEYFSRTTTFAKIEERMRVLFDIDPNKETHLRMQPMVECQWVAIDDKSMSLLHSGATECPVIAIGVVGEGEPVTGNGHGPFFGPHLPQLESNGHVAEENSAQGEEVGRLSPQPRPTVDAASSSLALVPFVPALPAPSSAITTASSSPKAAEEPFVGEPGVCGLTNMGASCYLSSALQCLSNAKPLAEYFLSGSWKEEVNEENKLGLRGEMAKAFGELLEQLWSGEHSSIRPVAFKEVLDKKTSHFPLYTQHDSHELLATVLDGLHEDLKRQPRANGTVEVAVEATAIDAEEKGESDPQPVHESERSSSIMDLIYGYQKSTIKCSICNNVSITREPFQVLCLSLLDNNLVPVDFTLVSTVHPENAPVVRTVRVPANASVRQFLDQVAAVTGTSASTLWAARIQSHALRTELEPEALLDSLSDIFVFEGPGESKDAEMTSAEDAEAMEATVKEMPATGPVVVEMVSGSGLHRSPFGLPVVFFPPPGSSDVRVSDLSEYVLAQCKRCLNNGWGLMCDAVESSAAAEPEPEPLFDLAESVDGELRSLSGDAVLPLTAGRPLKLTACWTFPGRSQYTESGLQQGPLFAEEAEAQPLSLAECMKRFTREEELDGDNAVFCSRCRQKQRSCKKIDLLNVPPVLVINLKRVTGSAKSSKVKIPVEFPLNDFDLSPWVKETEEPVGHYDLVAVSNHTGDLAERGHYSTLAKNWKNGRWYKFDDDEAKETFCSPDPKHAYMLVYVRKDLNDAPMTDQSNGDEHMEIA